MKPAFTFLILLAMTSASNASSMFAGLELPQVIDGKFIIGAGFGLVGILTGVVFLFVNISGKRKAQKVQLAYRTQLAAFQQSIRKPGANRF